MAAARALFDQSKFAVVGLVLLLGIGIGAGIALVGLASSLLTAQDASATHDATGYVHACVNRYTGQARVMVPGKAPNCTASEVLVEWPGTSLAVDVSALEARVDALELQVPDCLSESPDVAKDAVFSGCNVQINNGMATTETTNGKGNLIVGYNENTQAYARTGSHNIVVGKDHGYTNYGGLVAGFQNQISGKWATITGGSLNVAPGDGSSISGGYLNIASGIASSVLGGGGNEAMGQASTVSGGDQNQATVTYSSVSGGTQNTASGERSSVSGGKLNTASGEDSSVSGGSSNEASGIDSSASGGQSNVADGDWSSVSGGLNHTISLDGQADHNHDWIGGSQVEDF
jgi:hypothetical protein